ncbi:MAG: ABC transporter ATP-binding protein, partial [Candidatus Gerdarchaeota archaeon]
MQPVLDIRHIIAGYGDITIVNDVSMNVGMGEIVAIVGPNGSGKSTLLKSLLGFARVFQGQVFYQGEDITGVAPHKLIKQGIGYVPQIDNVFPNLTIAENLDMGAYYRKGKDTIKKTIAETFDMFPELSAR